MADPDPDIEFATTDCFGNEVVGPRAIWQIKIPRDHPDMLPFLTDVLRTIEAPERTYEDRDHRARSRYIGSIGGRRFLVVVAFEDPFNPTVGSVVTTYFERKPRKGDRLIFERQQDD